MRLTHKQFRELAAKHGLAVTHQRQVVYEAVVASHGHYSPEDIYAAVRRRIPSISLATVYNNLRLFIECGSVSYTHLDVYKRQARDCVESASAEHGTTGWSISCLEWHACRRMR